MVDPRNSQFNRARAVSRLLLAFVVFLLARVIAERSAHGFANPTWEPMLVQAMLAFMLLLGFAFLGLTQDKQSDPIAEQGFVRRAGWRSEAGLGIALGWAMAIACLIPVIVAGGLVVHFNFSAVDRQAKKQCLYGNPAKVKPPRQPQRARAQIGDAEQQTKGETECRTGAIRSGIPNLHQAEKNRHQQRRRWLAEGTNRRLERIPLKGHRNHQRGESEENSVR